jgi:phosphoenolpyruvate-protein kinase (PTS system EI component)
LNNCSASKKLQDMKKERERHAILSSLEELDEDPDLLAEVSSKMAERATAAERAKDAAREQEAMLKDALLAAGLNPDGTLRM